MNAASAKQASSMFAIAFRAVACLVISFDIRGGLLFGSAGSLTWLQGWLHIGLWLVTFAVNAMILLRSHLEVFSTRLKPKSSSERADTVLLVLFLMVTLAIPVIAGVDTVRFGWSSLPLWCICLGIALHGSLDRTRTVSLATMDAKIPRPGKEPHANRRNEPSGQ